MKIEYEIIKKEEIEEKHRKIFFEMLLMQGKVQGDPKTKADRCLIICLASSNNMPVAIGAIKKKTHSDFSNEKSGLMDLADQFSWELGYLFTKQDYEGKGVASTVVRMLLDSYGNRNLMASTEISANPGMVKILDKNGFKLFGKPWKSDIHDNYLGLFLKFK